MFKEKKLLLGLIITMVIMNLIPHISYSNSAEPPSIVIIVPNPPDDLEISIVSNNIFDKPNRTDKVFESYFAFYSLKLMNKKEYKLNIHTENNDFEILIDEPLEGYRNYFMLDLDNQKLTSGKPISRSIFLISIRIILTLCIEAFVFFIFGFRNKKSWIVFLIINLITQGGLNIWLNGFNSIESYVVLNLFFGEVIIFILEMIAFTIFLKENSISKRIFYVLVANLFSLIVGGYAITYLPI